jgi:arylsulfatase A-like enzyme
VDVRVTTGMIYGDAALLRARGMDVDSLSRALAEAAERLPGVERVYTPASLALATDEAAERWRRQFPADFDWFIAADPEPGWVWYTGTGADHESSALDDRRVPILFWGPGVPAARCGAVVPVVDIGPTLAAWLGIIPTERLDGQPLPLDRCRP